MTTPQKNTIERIIKIVERVNGNQTVSTLEIRKGHINLLVFNVIDKVDFIRITTYCDLDINTKGNITKGFLNELTPKTETKYPYIN